MLTKSKKLIILDLDGTLYNFQEGSFKRSSLRKKVMRNAEEYLMNKLNKTKKDASLVLRNVIKKYGENISIGLEKELGINRFDYFNSAWNIDAKKFIKFDPSVRKTMLEISRCYDYLLISDAPMIWVNNVLKELRIADIFNNKIISGEGDQRKIFGNTFHMILKDYKVKPENCVVIGDQEETDIIPAKKLGMRTIFVGRKNTSRYADHNIRKFKEITEILKLPKS